MYSYTLRLRCPQCSTIAETEVEDVDRIVKNYYKCLECDCIFTASQADSPQIIVRKEEATVC